MLVNFGAFQAGWFAAVLSAAAGRPWIGLLVMLAMIGLHLYRAARPRPEMLLLLLCGILGGAWDSLLVSAGWVSYPSGMLVPGLAPYWIIMMWVLFATTLNWSLGWLKRRPALAVALGAAGGPLAYYTGSSLGGIVLVEPVAALSALALGWAVMMPLLARLATCLDGISVPAPATGPRRCRLLHS